MGHEGKSWTTPWYYTTLLDQPYEPKLYIEKHGDAGSRIIAAKRRIAAALDRQAAAIGRVERMKRNGSSEATHG